MSVAAAAVEKFLSQSPVVETYIAVRTKGSVFLTNIFASSKRYIPRVLP